jgi:hypothetical protein
VRRKLCEHLKKLSISAFDNVPDRTLGDVYLLSAFIMQWCVVVILLKFLIALGVVFIELGKQLL